MISSPVVKSSSSWRLRLQYWGVLLKEQTNLKVNLVIGFIEGLVHSNQFFNEHYFGDNAKLNMVNYANGLAKEVFKYKPRGE